MSRLAWHFLRENKKLGYDDNRLVRRGHTFKCDPERLVLCRYGFHASEKVMDAILYAPGPVVCRVQLGGTILSGDDKLVASERTVIAMADATEILHEMACWSAEQALKTIKNPDPRSIAAIQAKRKWLRGEITDAELSAARSAAWSAAESAARSAARSAAWSAVESAARSAARSAAWSAVESAAWSAQNRKLTQMVSKLLNINEQDQNP